MQNEIKTKREGMKAHYGEVKTVVTLSYFLKVPCLNFNHVIIMKDFHNVLHVMVGQNPKKSNAKEATFLNFI
jgi:hypothetical protein